MFMDYKVSQLKGVGPKRVEQFERLDVHTIRDLLSFYPRTYQDWSHPVSIFGAELAEEKVCVRATVRTAPSRFKARSGIMVFECSVYDATATMKIVIFNNKYAAQKLEVGKDFLFYGKVTLEGNRREMLSPDIEEVGAKARIRPVYRTTKNMSSKYIEGCMEQALSQYGSFAEEPLPYNLREQYGLLSLKEALQEIHFPSSMERMMEARRRFIFEELLELQLGMGLLRQENRAGSDVILRNDCADEFYGLLPFEPTGAQKRAVEACLSDMRSGFLMNRLVQGDVGSGKTMVAAALVYVTAKNGYQSALMAPTEILAEQHYETMRKFFAETDVTVELLTGSTSAAEKTRIKTALRAGEIDFIVGTHALLTEDVWFDELGLVVTDEQHRFGVRQRGALAEKGEGAHVLVMSATPIPRTLALAIYGDLDVSVIDELPKGRQPIETYRIDSTIRERAYGYIKKFLDEGRQGYIVCPLVEEGETEDLVSATDYYERIRKGAFKDYRVGLLHGQMKAAEKNEVMQQFLQGNIQLLVATVVIEVGVDVPNAVIMLIENAERFGLSQLHQLRGRVGRGSHQSTCILLSDNKSQKTKERLGVLCQTTDGFEISRADLALRGPGDFFGKRQHGLPELRIADMMEDTDILEETGNAARALLEADPQLTQPDHEPLRTLVQKMFEDNLNSC